MRYIAKTRASIIENKMRWVIEENEEKNPGFYETLKLRLENLLAERQDKKFKDALDFKRLQRLLNEVM